MIGGDTKLASVNWAGPVPPAIIKRKKEESETTSRPGAGRVLPLSLVDHYCNILIFTISSPVLNRPIRITENQLVGRKKRGIARVFVLVGVRVECVFTLVIV